MLKNEGHRLLEEYTHLDDKRPYSQAKAHGYAKLACKMGVKEVDAHFKNMHTDTVIKLAIHCLRKMLKKRKDRLKYEEGKSVVFAPNLRELQKNIQFEIIQDVDKLST